MCIITNWQLSVCLYSVVRCRNPQCHRECFFFCAFFSGHSWWRWCIQCSQHLEKNCSIEQVSLCVGFFSLMATNRKEKAGSFFWNWLYYIVSSHVSCRPLNQIEMVLCQICVNCKYRIAVQRVNIISCWNRWFTPQVVMQTIFLSWSMCLWSPVWRTQQAGGCSTPVWSFWRAGWSRESSTRRSSIVIFEGVLRYVFRLLNLLNWSTEDFSLD